MFAMLANGYPRGPLPAQPDRLAEAERRFAAGELDAAGLAAATDEYVRQIVDEQVRAGLAFICDGGVRAPDRMLPLIRGLDGLATGPAGHLPSGELITRPRVPGPVAWRGPIFLDDWRHLSGLADLPAKQVVPGPYTIGRIAALERPADRSAVTLGLAEALNSELHALAAAGVSVIQIDEDAATMIGDDGAEWVLFEAAHRALTAGLESDIVHLSLAILGGAVHADGYAATLDRPYRSFLFDALAGPEAWQFAFAVPDERGLVVGAVDAHRPTYDEIEVMVRAMAWAADGGRGEERVGIAPNGSLAQIDRHYARRKCERMGEAVRIARMGPLIEVAEALEPDPAHARWPELRALAAAAEAAWSARTRMARTATPGGAIRPVSRDDGLGYAGSASSAAATAGEAPAQPEAAEDAVQSIELEIRNPSGLHARPAALFVRAAASSPGTVRVANLTRGGPEADAKSILAVLKLGVSQGHHVRITVDGDGAAATLERLAGLIEGGLGEPLPPPESGEVAAG